MVLPFLALLASFGAAKPSEVLLERARELFQPLPPGGVVDQRQKARVDLGRMLFYDVRLSKNHDVSCNSCHDLLGYGVDGKQFSTGHKGQQGGRNAPTVYNAANHIAQFWDGRAESLEAQATGPMLNPVEMGMPDQAHIEATLRSIPGYLPLFQKGFPKEADPVNLKNTAASIAAFEKGLTTPGRFDRYLGGDTTALTAAEKKGLELFMASGCTTCHNGPAMGGQSFQRLGLVEPYPDNKDPGRFEVTKDEEDRMKFRVPSIRNVTRTAPYLHNGSLRKLEDVVKTMGRYQLGKALTQEEISSIVDFLGSLAGDIPQGYVKKPALPPSGSATPKPDPT